MRCFLQPPGAPPTEAPEPGPRLYHPPTMPEFQALKETLEQEWVPAMQQLLEIDSGEPAHSLGLRFSARSEGRRRQRHLCALRDQRQQRCPLS